MLLDEDGSYRCQPPEFAEPGFLEGWHDGEATARRIFAAVYLQVWRYHQDALDRTIVQP